VFNTPRAFMVFSLTL